MKNLLGNNLDDEFIDEFDGDFENSLEFQEEPSDFLSEEAKRLFDISYLFPYQRLVINNILEAAKNDNTGQNITGKQIVILPTGAGKSLCFQLPAALIDGATLVIYPLLSLMTDQKRRLEEKGFSPVVLRGEQTETERKEIWQKLESGQSKFIIANPEILQTASVMQSLTKIKISHIVIDEAHCVSEWGESFRSSYLEINTIIEKINAPIVTAFTATASAEVLQKIKHYIFKCDNVHQIVGKSDRPNIEYTAMGCVTKDIAVRDLLIKNSRPAIVFCSSRYATQKLARYLNLSLAQMGFDWSDEIKFYHAGLSREEKADIEKWFFSNSDAVLCATCAYGMGVDKADIRTVIHRDSPPSVEAYLQETGRAGRDGLQSKAIFLWGPEDDKIENRVKNEKDKARLLGLLNYAKDAEHCRRSALANMLDIETHGESPEKNCCDVCTGKASVLLREELSLRKFFLRNKNSYFIEEAASVLSESKNHFWSQKEAKQTIKHFIDEGKIKVSKNIFWKKTLSWVS